MVLLLLLLLLFIIITIDYYHYYWFIIIIIIIIIIINLFRRLHGLNKHAHIGTILKFVHYGDAKWPSCRLELPDNQVFIQQGVQTNNKEISKVRVAVLLWW